MKRMFRPSRALLLSLMLTPLVSQLCAQNPAPISVTLFNSGKVLVRRALPVNIPVGTSTHALELGNFTPATLQLQDSGVTLTRINSDITWSEDALLRRNIGHRFEIEEANHTRRSATLMSLDPEHWKWSDGAVVFGRPGKILWPTSIVPASRIADVTLASVRSLDTLHLTYETGGGSWFANYGLFLGADSHLDGVATVSAGTLDLREAEVQLYAGDIGSSRLQAVRPSVAPTGQPSDARMLIPQDRVTTRQTVSRESIGDAPLYTLPGRLSFVAGTQTVVPLFDRLAVAVETRYIVNASLPVYATRNRPDGLSPSRVAYQVRHGAGTTFGELPLPEGNVNIYNRDMAGRRQLVGQSSVDQIGRGMPILIEAGTSFDVTAHVVESEFTHTGSSNGGDGTSTANYQVTVQNVKDSAVTADVRLEWPGEWTLLESSQKPEIQSSTRQVFSIVVPAHGTAVVSYRVRVVL